MGSNFAARAADSGDLEKFRSEGQWSRLGLAIQHPVTVYTARINQTFDSLDGVAQLTYDGGSGTLGDVLAGMTIYIGSSAGGRDKGVCRVRKLPTSTKLYINQTSDIRFADNDYITIVDSFGLWQRDITVTGGTVRMDYDIEYGSYLNGGAIPRIGPLVAVLHLVDGSATFSPPDPTLSACYDGATIVSYAYAAPGAATTADMDTDAPSWTYEAAGEYRWSCAITDSSGRVTTSYRWIFINPETIPFKFENASGDFSTGNWSMTATCLEDVAKSQVFDRALCTLYTSDYYGGVKASVGKITGYRNILCSGWIDGESISFDSESGEVSFTIQGPAFWLEKIRAFPLELQDVTGVPANWKQITEMTVDKAIAFLLFWTSTAPLVMDCFLTGNTTREKIFAQPSGSLLEQINAIASKIFASALVNNYGQLYIEIDPQKIPLEDRGDLPVVMDITKKDRLDGLEIERNVSSKTSMIELSGWYYDGTTRAQIYSRAPGGTPKIFGGIDTYDDFLIADQEECNRISGCLLAIQNNEFEPLEITFSANNRLFDICPRMYATISIAAEDNPRGVALDNVRLIPRQVEWVPDEESGSLQTKVTFEFEAIGVDGITYVPPVATEENADYGMGDIGNVDFPVGDLGFDFPPITDGPPNGPCTSTPNSFTVGWTPRELIGDVGPLIAKAYFPCKLRNNDLGSGGPSKITINMSIGGDAASNYTVSAFKGADIVATASPVSGTAATWEFILISEVDCDGFQIILAGGVGSIVSYTPLDVISSGSVDGNNSAGINVDVEDGKLYCIEAVGGYWRYQKDAFPLHKFYNFSRGNASDQYGVGYTPTFPLEGGGFGGMSLAVPLFCITSEAVTSLYGRTYFIGDGSLIFNFCVSDFLFSDNDGHLDFVLRNARLNGRRMELNTALIQNVCSVSG